MASGFVGEMRVCLEIPDLTLWLAEIGGRQAAPPPASSPLVSAVTSTEI